MAKTIRKDFIRNNIQNMYLNRISASDDIQFNSKRKVQNEVPYIRDWLRQMSDPNFPFHTLDEGLEIDDNSEVSDDDEENYNRDLDVDPLCGWSRKKFVCEGGRKDKNGNIFGKVWISLPGGGEFR